MNRQVRRALERIFLDRIWVGKPTAASEIAALIAKLRPSPVGNLARFGPQGDGGYLMPDDLEEVRACISPGVSLECGFDEDIAARGIDVIMADASVAGPPSGNRRFYFIRKFVEVYESEQTTTMEKLCGAIPGSDPTGDLILQMDIEGAEYRVLGGLDGELLKRFRIMVVEFHQLDHMFSKFGFDYIRPVFEKMTKHHAVVHIHPNNCLRPVTRQSLVIPPVMEFTFYRTERALHNRSPAAGYPHMLDADNVVGRPPVALPECWWRASP